MNPIHVHLALNHLPIVGVPVGFILLQWGARSGSRELKRAGLAALVLSALAAFAVFFSGEGAEKAAGRLAELPSALVELHEEWAEATLWAVSLLGAMAGWGLWRGRRQGDPPPRLVQAAAFLAAVCSLMLARTAWLGGQIRHPEIQPDWRDSLPRGIPEGGPRGEI